jgi:two-component system, OmpR family, heavy metal sensor histidine kinase CusS
MKRWPLSTKLTVWLMLLVGIAVLSCAIGTGFYLKRAQTDMLDSQLKGEAKYFFTQWGQRRLLSQAERLARIKELIPYSAGKRLIEIRDLGRHLLYRSFENPKVHLSVSTLGVRTVKLHRENYRLGTFEKDDVILSLAGDMREIEHDAGARALTVLGILPFLLLVCGFGGWWIARTALAPISAMAEAAEQMTAQRLDARLEEPPVDDEIGRLTRVLNEMFRRLNESFRQTERFSADASHELKTPLTVLRNSIEDLLESPTLGESDREAVASLLEQTRRLSAITESLLLLSRADTGRLQLDRSLVDVCEIIQACAEDAEILAEEKGISIAKILPESIMAGVDAGRLNQILWNVLDNAIKYNETGGRIEIQAGTDLLAKLVWIEIGNSGPGVPAVLAPHLFERFFRSDPLGNEEGHGLGLSLSRELARAHGGDVILKSSQHGWTVFRATLKLVMLRGTPGVAAGSSERLPPVGATSG